jgi:hypothetical protein
VAPRDERSWVFIVRGAPDIDNIVPVAWAAARSGRRVVVIVASRYSPAHDPRFSLLGGFRTVNVMHLPKADVAAGWGRLRRVRWCRRRVRRLLRRLNAGVVCVEWREGIAGETSSPISVVTRRLFGDFIDQALHAARDLGIPTVALPHGHSVKTSLVRSPHVRATLDAHGGKLPFANRDSFAAYVFCSGYHRDVIVSKSTMSGRNAVVWGSARFSEEWVAQLTALTAGSVKIARRPNTRRVLFFVPKWHNLVDRAGTIELLTALSRDARLHVLVKAHPRADHTSLTSDERSALTTGGSLEFIEGPAESAALLGECDVLVDVDSSIALDAVVRGIPYVRPRWLQDASVTTIWDRGTVAHQPGSLDETIELLTSDRLSAGVPDEAFIADVIGGRGSAPLDRYVAELARIAR